METSDYGIQGNRNSGSIGMCFRFCRDECLRLRSDQLLESDSYSGSNSRNSCRSNSGGNSGSSSGTTSGTTSGSESDYCDLVLGHQFQ